MAVGRVDEGVAKGWLVSATGCITADSCCCWCCCCCCCCWWTLVNSSDGTIEWKLVDGDATERGAAATARDVDAVTDGCGYESGPAVAEGV